MEGRNLSGPLCVQREKNIRLTVAIRDPGLYTGQKGLNPSRFQHWKGWFF
ncbi:hypothetical protein BACCAP_02384 [Pseudoflavonifractor capillosus ATCC 29799]|uniref:Uncharacterized protein n=1 Tax=Pseudoflavonifractor capillosus ATCC 29799 TaxID=411467 RepID=A6NVZ1_9FIRM|nr:hypothetical protein BACCAP_02384 [Pseudoflavonifractor capillosus ATCC 29799]